MAAQFRRYAKEDEMGDLIKALQIFLKYGNLEYPTYCEHDVLKICGINPVDVSDDDKNELDKLGFIIGGKGEDDKYFMSFRYGS